jgi:hypothetical protein
MAAGAPTHSTARAEEASGAAQGFLDSTVASVDGDDLAADVIGGRRGEVKDQVGDFDRLAESTQRDAGFYRGAFRLVTPDFLAHVGQDDGRRDSVGLNVELSPFGGHDLREQVESALGSAVRGVPFDPNNAGQRRDIDDLAAALLDHFRHNGLREQERGAKVNALDLIPLLGRGFEDALAMKDSGVVHEDVHGPEESEGLRTGSARPIDGLQIGLDRDAAAALAEDWLPRRFKTGWVPADDGDVGACISQDDCDFRTDSLRGARHERSFAFNTEAGGVVGHLLSV